MKNTPSEIAHEGSDPITAVDINSSGKEISISTLGGQVIIYDREDGNIRTTIDCKNDIRGGRHTDDRNTSKGSTKNCYFNSICYNSTGENILGGGNSKYICLYDVAHKVLIKKFMVTNNRSLDGVLNKLNSKNINEFGEVGQDDESDAEWDKDDKEDLPGVKKPNQIKRKTKLAIRVLSVKFSPDGKSFACATTEGVIIYSLANSHIFVPLDLDIEVTLENLVLELKKHNYLQALVMALKFNQVKIIEKTFELIPTSAIAIISSNFPINFLRRFMNFIAYELEHSVNIELALTWCKQLIKFNDEAFNQMRADNENKAIHRALKYYEGSLLKISNENLYTLKFLNFEEPVDTEMQTAQE